MWLNDNNDIVWVVCAITENGVNQVCYALNILLHWFSCQRTPKDCSMPGNANCKREKDTSRRCERNSWMLICVSSYCMVFVQSKKTHDSPNSIEILRKIYNKILAEDRAYDPGCISKTLLSFLYLDWAEQLIIQKYKIYLKCSSDTYKKLSK